MESNKSQFSNIPTGSYLSETQYYKVIENTPTSIRVQNERGFEFTIGKNIVEEGIYTAHQYKEEKQITRTELISIFSSIGDTVFTVCFNKQPTVEAINSAIESANKGKIIPIKELKKIVKEAYKGEERILRGYLVQVETGFGRSMVIDLEADKGTRPDYDGRLRQVDHRTLKWLIYKNVKYIVK